jgi:hypothetical protein
MAASTGILLLDVVARPFFKVGMKFPAILFIALFLVYGAIAYGALKSAYLSENN